MSRLAVFSWLWGREGLISTAGPLKSRVVARARWVEVAGKLEVKEEQYMIAKDIRRQASLSSWHGPVVKFVVGLLSDVHRLVNCSSGSSSSLRRSSFWPFTNFRMRNDDSGSGPSPNAYANTLGIGMLVLDAITLRVRKRDGERWVPGTVGTRS